MTAKQRILAILDEQPDDSSFEELLRELAFAQMVDRGIEDSDAGRTISHAELEDEFPRGQSRLDARSRTLATEHLRRPRAAAN